MDIKNLKSAGRSERQSMFAKSKAQEKSTKTYERSETYQSRDEEIKILKDKIANLENIIKNPSLMSSDCKRLVDYIKILTKKEQGKWRKIPRMEFVLKANVNQARLTDTIDLLIEHEYLSRKRIENKYYYKLDRNFPLS